MKRNILLTSAFVFAITSSVHALDDHAGHDHSDHDHSVPGQAETASPVAGPHGGSLKRKGDVQLETIVSQGGIQMFVYGRNGQQLAVNQGRGAASLRVEGNAKRYRYDLLPDGKGGLAAPVNLSQIAGRQIEIEIQLVGIAVTRGQTISFREVATVPATETQLAAAAIARQKICPVSGKPLGSMGDPVAVDVNGQRLFVCCGGCVGAVKSNPGKYASGRPEITVTSATQADAELIARQKVCPVMDEPLGGMGNPIKVTIGDKPIFLCCKGCIKKVKADPAEYLAMVYGTESTTASETAPAAAPNMSITVTSATQADAELIARQKVCPVMDEPLGGMGNPIKVMVGDKPIFLCCKGCIKKVKADPAMYLEMVYGGAAATGETKASVSAGTEQVRTGVFKVSAEDAPFIAAQKLCPVMDEPLDAMGGPYKVHAAGKAVYICCPGCAKKIAAQPQKYLAVLADQGVNSPLLR